MSGFVTMDILLSDVSHTPSGGASTTRTAAFRNVSTSHKTRSMERARRSRKTRLCAPLSIRALVG